MTEHLKSKNQAAQELNEVKSVRVIRWYDKESEKLVGEFVLKAVNLADLQNLFGESKVNLMVDSYPISTTQASYLQKYIDQAIKLESFDYYLECDAI